MGNGDGRQPNEKLLTFLMYFCGYDATIKRRTQAKVARILKTDNIKVDETLLTKIKSGERKWSDELLARAFDVIKAGKHTARLEYADLFRKKTYEIIDKLDLPSQELHILLSMLGDIGGSSRPIAEELKSLVGCYASVFLCTDPSNINEDTAVPELGVAIDAFELIENDSNRLLIQQTNYVHNEKFTPEGSVGLRGGNILEFDIDYKEEKYPIAKYLAFLPPGPNVLGKYNFLATMLDVKIRSRLVVARPLIFIQIDEPYTEWKIHHKSSKLFEVASAFLGKNTQFEPSNFELCPTREPDWQQWRPVVDEVRAVIAGVSASKRDAGG